MNKVESASWSPCKREYNKRMTKIMFPGLTDYTDPSKYGGVKSKYDPNKASREVDKDFADANVVGPSGSLVQVHLNSTAVDQGWPAWVGGSTALCIGTLMF